MAILNYINEQGETRYRVYVNMRSKTNKAIRAQRRLAGVKTVREAEREETNLIRECEREINDREAQGACWGAVVEGWDAYLKKDSGSMSSTTREDYAAALRNHTSHWWKRPAANITALDIKEMLGQMKTEGRSHGFQKKFKNMFNRIFVFGIQSGLIHGLDRSPAYGLKLDRPQEKRPEILTISEIKKLLVEAKGRQHPWYPIWAIALLTGMRNGELYALEWQDISWENKTITLSRSYNKRRRETKSTKAGYWRMIPISGELMALLTELRASSNSRPYVLPHYTEWQMGLQAEVLRKFCIGIGISSIRFHTLRACFATQLIRAGVPAIQLQKICGWSDLKTMQRYIRLAGIEVDGATEHIKFLPTLLEEEAQSARQPASLMVETASEMSSLATSWLPSHLTT